MKYLTKRFKNLRQKIFIYYQQIIVYEKVLSSFFFFTINKQLDAPLFPIRCFCKYNLKNHTNKRINTTKKLNSHCILFWSPKKLTSKCHNRSSFSHDCCQAHFFLQYPVQFHHHVTHGRPLFTRRVNAPDSQLHELFHAFSGEAIAQSWINDGRYVSRFLIILYLKREKYSISNCITSWITQLSVGAPISLVNNTFEKKKSSNASDWSGKHIYPFNYVYIQLWR